MAEVYSLRTLDGQSADSTGNIDSIAALNVARAQSTRVLSGAGVSINADPTKFDIDVTGEFVDPVTLVRTPITKTVVGTVATQRTLQTESYITIDQAGTIVQSLVPPSPSTYPTIIGTWVLYHNNLSTLDGVDNAPMYSDIIGTGIHQMLDFDGFRKKTGSNIISAGTVTTRLSHSGGAVIRNGGNGGKLPVFNLTAQVDASFKMKNRSGADETASQLLDVNNIDIAGVTTLLPNGRFGAHKVWKNSASQIKIQRGQRSYTNINNAITGITQDAYVNAANSAKTDIHIGWVIAKKNTTWSTGVSGIDYVFLDSLAVQNSAGTTMATFQSVLDASQVAEVLIRSENDLPAPIAGNITLVDNTAYRISGSVTFTNTLTLGASNKIFGLDKSSDIIVYTGTGTFFMGSNKDVTIENLTIIAASIGSSVFALNGSSNLVEIKDLILKNCQFLGSIGGSAIAAFSKCLIMGCSSGLNISGTNGSVNIFDNLWTGNVSTMTNLSIPSGTIAQLKLSRQVMDVATTQTGINISNTATIASGVVSDCEFTGAGNYLLGVNYLTPNWSFLDCRGIVTSIIAQPMAIDRSSFQIRATNGTRVSTGIITNGYGTATNNTDGTSVFTKYTSAATVGDIVGLETVTFNEIPINADPIFSAVIRTSADISSQIIWVGMVQVSPINSDDQPSQSVAFRYSTVAGDTGWRAIVDNGTQTISVNIGTIAVNTLYKLEIRVDYAATKCYFRVNGGSWTIVSQMPLNGTTFGLTAELATTTAAIRSFDFSRLDGSHT